MERLDQCNITRERKGDADRQSSQVPSTTKVERLDQSNATRGRKGGARFHYILFFTEAAFFIYISYLVFRRYILLCGNDFLVTEATFLVYKSYIPCFQKLHSSK